MLGPIFLKNLEQFQESLNELRMRNNNAKIVNDLLSHLTDKPLKLWP